MKNFIATGLLLIGFNCLGIHHENEAFRHRENEASSQMYQSAAGGPQPPPSNGSRNETAHSEAGDKKDKNVEDADFEVVK